MSRSHLDDSCPHLPPLLSFFSLPGFLGINGFLGRFRFCGGAVRSDKLLCIFDNFGAFHYVLQALDAKSKQTKAPYVDIGQRQPV